MQPPEEDGKEKPNPYISEPLSCMASKTCNNNSATNRYSTVLQCTKDAVNTQFQ